MEGLKEGIDMRIALEKVQSANHGRDGLLEMGQSE